MNISTENVKVNDYLVRGNVEGILAEFPFALHSR